MSPRYGEAVINFLWKAFKPRTDVMDKRRPTEDFTCPKCGAEYKLVRMPAPAESRDSPLHCKICNQEFASTDGESILKYFLVSRRRPFAASTSLVPSDF